MLIKSKSNEIVKHAIKLKDKKYRNIFSQFLVENEKILIEAKKNGYEIDTIFYSSNSNYNYGENVKLVETNEEIMKAISSTSSPAKCVAIVNKKSEVNLNINSHFLVLDRLQDPANVGAIIRSCLGADFGTVLLIDCADIYDSKVIRASMGAIFNVPCIKVSQEEVLKLDNPLVIMDMNGQNIFNLNFDKNINYGFVVGNEGQGVCKEIKDKASKIVSIPMNEKLESLNASVSASIVMYAISRNLKENL
ncbi:MAG: RNA methyltransferase [Clostridia bacterium]|nr:RNA methyltransferase [Clostridia bacterium]